MGCRIVRIGVPREDIFVTTKVWTSDFGNAADTIYGSLERGECFSAF